MTGERDSCIRCGACCLQSSPSLQVQDVPLVLDGDILRSQLVTIRPGEVVWDNIHEELIPTHVEIIKVRDRGGICIFYDDSEKGCRIYEQRPVQCAFLECWDLTKLMRAYAAPKACRSDIIRDGVLLGLLKEHELKCGYDRLVSLVQQIESRGEDAVEEILDLLKFDYHLRPFVSQKMGINPDEMDFIFGRLLIHSIAPLGLKVVEESDGSFFLTTLTH